MPVAYLVCSVLGLLATIVATVRVRRPGPLSFPVQMTSWLTGELALWHIAWQVVATAVFGLLGAFSATAGRVGLALSLVSGAGLLLVWRNAWRAAPAFEAAFTDALGPGYRAAIGAEWADQLRTSVDRRLLWRPFSFAGPGVTVTRDIAYGDEPRHRLDVFRPRQPPAEPRPVVLQVHGGGWVIGNKKQQGQPLMNHLAARGYPCVAINYRLAPKSRFPACLLDVKRAIAWIRTHPDEHGGDASRIVITGGSAGGHLSLLAALTAGDPSLQPGFEDVDTSVVGCVPFYPPTDFYDRHHIRGRTSMEGFLTKVVMPAERSADPAIWDLASPLSQLRPDAPPMLIVQGAIDVLVYREETRRFADDLRAVSNAPVIYAEIPGAQHAFDTFNSRRSAAAVDAVEVFLGLLCSEALSVPGEGASGSRSGTEGPRA